MLPRWLNLMRDELILFIRPNSIVLRRIIRSGLSREKQDAHKKLLLKHVIGQKEMEAGYLSKVLKSVLSDSQWQAAGTTLILSNYFARYTTIPWNSDIRSDEERAGFLHHQFTKTYGDGVASWHKAQTTVEYGKYSLASAVPTALIESIKTVFAETQTRLDAIQPYLMHIANQAFQVIEDKGLEDGCWLVMIADGRLTIGLVVMGEWIWIKGTQLEVDVRQQILTLIKRECILNETVSQALSGEKRLPILLDWPEMPGSQDLLIDDYRIIKLSAARIFADLTRQSRAGSSVLT